MNLKISLPPVLKAGSSGICLWTFNYFLYFLEWNEYQKFVSSSIAAENNKTSNNPTKSQVIGRRRQSKDEDKVASNKKSNFEEDSQYELKNLLSQDE